MRGIVERTRSWGAEPILMVWPSRPQMTEARVVEHQEMIRSLAREQKVRLVDLIPAFQATS
jgi:hypothetical protein